MKLLFKHANILDATSAYHNTVQDVLIENGIFTKIEKEIIDTTAQIIIQDGLTLSTGFVDIFSHFNDPGLEQKETLETGAKAAQKGGYTTVFVLPNTEPVLDNKSSIEYILQNSKKLPINIVPIGAITTQCDGKNLAEMIEMHHSGAVAFSDGLHPIQNAGLLLKALQYVKAFNGIIIQLPYDENLTNNGLMNEGITATQMGVQGSPAIAEESMVATDVELCAYTNSRLHITGISTAKSLAQIKEAKAKGTQVTCSVSPYHLLLTDNDVQGYNTNAKVKNPLRTNDDVKALQQGVIDGSIDCIASHHQPHEMDAKQCEFANAAYGMSTIEQCLQVVASIPNISTEKIHQLMCAAPSQIFGLASSTIAVGNTCNLTAFTLATQKEITKEDLISKGKNSAFIGKTLSGKIIATICKNEIYIAK